MQLTPSGDPVYVLYPNDTDTERRPGFNLLSEYCESTYDHEIEGIANVKSEPPLLLYSLILVQRAAAATEPDSSD
jgi:hypothetical protein